MYRMSGWRVIPEIQLSGEPSLLAEIEYRAKSAEGKICPLSAKKPRGFMSKTA
jgi:hypothetical protein